MRPPSTRLLACWLALIFATALPAVLRGQATVPAVQPAYPASLFSVDYVTSVWSDTRAVLTAPARWDDQDIRDASLWAGGTLLAAGFDHQIRKQAQTHFRTRSEDNFATNWQRLGAEYSLVEIAAFEVWGVAADNPNARHTAMDAVTATVIASGIFTPMLKYSLGRYRPNQTTRTFKFRPFSGHQSFPSGHATQAFAVATVVANHYREPWQQALSYGAAALVDLSRVQQNAHFASDVVAGSAVGWAVGRAVVHRHESAHVASFDVQPVVAWSFTGLVFTRTY